MGSEMCIRDSNMLCLAMADYPRTVLEFRDWFADDAACRDYLARLRWPEGFRCPICRGADHWVTARGGIAPANVEMGGAALLALSR